MTSGPSVVRRTTWDAVVVGAGPNGLTAAARLARAGRSVLVLEAAATVGGGCRTVTLGSARVDHCAAVHPFGASSLAFEELALEHAGLTWLRPPVALAHPFDGGRAATLPGQEPETGRLPTGPPGDEDRWRRIVEPLLRDWADWRHRILRPVTDSIRRDPLPMARFGLLAALPSTALARMFRTAGARALIAGCAAHTGVPLSTPTTAGVALGLLIAGQSTGMPVAEGGSQAIVDALAAVATANGTVIECDRPVRTRRDVPAARALLLDLTPTGAAAVLNARPPRWRYGVGASKLDLVLSGPLPWTADACRCAGTVHLGGPAAEITAAERSTVQGTLPDRPFVLVAQPTTADPSRAPHGRHVVSAYCHVPTGWQGRPATVGIEAQFDRFAPGWRDLVVDRRVTTPQEFAAGNANFIGGDIAGGAMTARQTVARPRLARDPYRLGDGAWLCSQSTPPGPGVHGMCGWHAAGSVLAD